VRPTQNAPRIVFIALALTLGCGSAQKNTPGGTGGGEEETGGSTGGSPGTGGKKMETGGSGGDGTGGAPQKDAAPEPTPDGAPAADTGGQADTGGGMTADAPPALLRPDAMGAACITGMNYNFTIRPFPSQNGTFTAYFDATPSTAPTNSVIGLSDGMKYLHDNFAAIIRFAENGNLDARNGAAYSGPTPPLKYMATTYSFRLVVNVPAKTYSAHVSWGGNPEVTIGTNLAFRDSAGVVNKLDYFGVESIAPNNTKVCGFLVVP